MKLLSKSSLVLLYPLLILSRALNAICDRDPLRLREPGGSCWIPRASQPDSASYFSEASLAEGRGQGGFGWLVRGPLKLLACLHTPRRSAHGGEYSAAADREKGIPDEIYTLW